MGKSKNAIAIIPARGGSKRIPKKNIRNFFGQPIIHYSIKTALQSGLFEEVVVSTDSKEIADVAKKEGAVVPFMRPAPLAEDHSGTTEVLHHALSILREKSGKKPPYACCILATAPFMRIQHLVGAYEKIRKEKVTTVIPVTTFEYPILRSMSIDEGDRLRFNWPENEMKRSNDLPPAYHDVGQFFWVDTEKFLKANRIFTTDTMPYLIPRKYVQDLDTLEDWERAELLFEVLMKELPKE